MCVGVAETGHRGESAYADGMESSFLFWLLATLGFYLVGGGAWLAARGVAEKYAEKRQNILITFIKCTIHDKIEDNRASGAKMMGGERQRQRRGTRLACARWRRETKAGFPVILRKTFLSIIYRQCYNFVTGRLQVYYKSGKGIDKRRIYE